jgi:predicted nucleotidyltransferase
MDKKQAVAIAELFADAVKEHFQVKKVVLYGSQAKGNSHELSDIDIAVIIEETKDDFLDSEAKLYKLRRTIDLRIEPILLEESKDASGFIQQIMKEGQVIYSLD